VYGPGSVAVALGPGFNSAGVGGVGATFDLAFASDRVGVSWDAVTDTGGTFTISDNTGAVLATVNTGGFGVAFTGVTQISGLGSAPRTLRGQVTAGSVGHPGLIVPAATPRLIVWEQEPPYNLDAVTETVRQGYQAAIMTVLPQFDTTRIVVITTPPTWDPTVDTCPDGVHPSASGHRKIADWGIQRILAAGIKAAQGIDWVTGPQADPTTYTVPPMSYNRPGSTVPVAATGVSAVTDQQVFVSWSRGTDGGASVTSQKIQATTDNGATYIDALTIPDGTTSSAYVRSGLTAGTSYRFRIGATNPNGTTWSGLSTAITAGSTAVVYASDTFTRPDTASDPGVTEVGGFAWAPPTATGDVWGITGGQLATKSIVSPRTGLGLAVLTIDDGHSDGTWELQFGNLRGNEGLYICSTAGTTAYLIYYSVSSGNVLMQKQTALGSLTTLNTVAATVAPLDKLKIVKSLTGSVYTVKLNATVLGTFTDATYTGTKHGVYGGSAAQLYKSFVHSSATVV
jgi:hypothetical protein